MARGWSVVRPRVVRVQHEHVKGLVGPRLADDLDGLVLGAAEAISRDKPWLGELPERPPIRALLLADWNLVAVYLLVGPIGEGRIAMLHLATSVGPGPHSLSEEDWRLARDRLYDPASLGVD